MTVISARDRLTEAAHFAGTTTLEGPDRMTLLGGFGRIIVHFNDRGGITTARIMRPGDIARNVGGGRNQIHKIIDTIQGDN